MVPSGSGTLAFILVVALQQTARDPRPQPVVGTAVIAGRVMTADAGAQPVRRARVTVTSTNLEITRAVITDDEGRFAVQGLPASRYSVAATKPGYLRAGYGASRPTRPGTSFDLAAGQRLADLTLRMARGGVITGMVTDESGRPAAGIAIRALQSRYQDGARTLAPVTVTPGTTGQITDDRGEFRLFGLAPGEYAIAAVPTDEGAGTTRAMTGGTVGYVPVYFPGTVVPADALMVTVSAGEETSGVNLPLRFVPTARIEGTVSSADAIRPQDVHITLAPLTPGVLAGGSDPAAMLSAGLRMLATLTPDRTFAYAGVVPGRYRITARVLKPPADGTTPRALGPAGGQVALWAMADVTIDGRDVTGLALNLEPGLTLSGRLRFRAAAGAATPAFSTVRVSLYATEPGRVIAFAQAPVTVAVDGSFSVNGIVPGFYRLSATIGGNAAGPWSVLSAIVNGRDTLDFPLEMRPGEPTTNAVLTMGMATQRLSGMLQDAAARPATNFTVVLFPADREYWASMRRIRTAKPGQDGRYTISTLPPGEYRLAAVEDIGPGDQYDPVYLEALVPASVMVTLREGASKVQDLRIAR
jgi:5-hydroxyisourate hydrolase-like protein (transthyretin family)